MAVARARQVVAARLACAAAAACRVAAARSMPAATLLPPAVVPLVATSRAHSTKQASAETTNSSSSKRSLEGVPSFRDFMREQGGEDDPGTAGKAASAAADDYVAPAAMPDDDDDGDDGGSKDKAAASTSATAAVGVAGGPPCVYIETFGCQMNEADTEVVVAILGGVGYVRTTEVEEADVILTNTCAVREGAESKVWHRLGAFKNMKRRRPRGEARPVVGVLGCMAERLKTQLLEADKEVDLVVGPDAYRDLPRLLAMVRNSSNGTNTGGSATAVNVQLSQDETYADITPVRTAPGSVSAYVSIMRGCNNMCSFCIVPFTRGRERSRDAGTIVAEVVRLAEEGVREVTLLGQNVNSYHDASTPAGGSYAGSGYEAAAGFNNMYKARGGDGVRFTELLDRVSAAAPEVRIRFTSPHPKDFPDALLALMAARPNIAKSIHLPAQSGSTPLLAAMRRGYTADAYRALAHRIRASVPGVALSSDFISGFCGETDADHADTLALLRDVQYEAAFMFAYSRRDRTHAAHHYADDVPPAVKQARLAEVIATFRAGAAARNAAEVGRVVVALTEGAARRSTPAAPMLVGRTDNNKRIVWPPTPLPTHGDVGTALRPPRAGEYVVLRVTEGGVSTLQASPLAITTLAASPAAVAALQ